ncbi:hypothetical protein M430DRAFT_109902 [Amorphotheca resinae ATCC 22711]|uniref:Uncharacterized protein n=1 Tax=Amorphotheca resinae ATCC 22711 TaxID=857342 RepID=A0A2T3AQH6_AMORE|nr:hypothetical protein M430DRAFT_109902 [Amorphotheca resinae ATCC 22711]PSS08482.1 hypothetical protein M430DRAFT_109902 [Amorphotheca resinae ATCC 22711]
MSSYPGQGPKSRVTKVKPILRKLAQSEKSSLDLDRPLAEQDGLGIYDYGAPTRSVHDVVFQSGRRGYHNRSASGTSQFSTATSNSTGQRTGSFVHPFQQTPRPHTPPLAASHNSLRESDPLDNPALAEDEDHHRHHIRSTSSISNRTPSLTSTITPIANTHPQPLLRIQTKQSSSRIALAPSHTSLHNHLTPLSPVDLTSSLDTMSPTSAIRTSFDKGFRLRSRSEVDSRERALTIQEARRRFQEKEQAKDEKAAREEVRQLEKRNQKEAQRMERSHRQSSASTSEGTRSKRSKSDLTMQNEKLAANDLFVRSAPGRIPPYVPAEEEQAEPLPRRSYSATNNAKKRTHSAWTKLMMWIRTRFIRMKGRARPAPPPNPYYGYGARAHQ